MRTMGSARRISHAPWLGRAVLVALQVILVSSGFAAQAGVLTSIGTGYSFEKAGNGRDYEVRQFLAARAGYRFTEADLFLEYSRFRSNQGVQSVDVTRDHNEILLWGRRVLTEGWRLSPFASIGSGVQFDVVTTRFNGDTRRDHGSPRAMAALALGAQVMMFGKVELVLEGRMSFSANFAPNPLPGAGAFLGWTF
jgi:hypothetical protein